MGGRRKLCEKFAVEDEQQTYEYFENFEEFPKAIKIRVDNVTTDERSDGPISRKDQRDYYEERELRKDCERMKCSS
ncbi:predicted protein [Sclerotinia sclerotiorum 1980 UF-70]|uniref:Uncharacterized protein n=1 Tax=Sclerotinia sclerotiorum (strain ATCC 18683 / 1980 / Ss-1) TaxID=665079 RepID=A7F0K4_SCLS1|nr:predicted protein [Sclerotinia sclerotiorum 1980 UF-70]EDN95246.1 predicted protein [Sclerotinia sclerotiorum 1980 UF-70]